MLGDTLVFDGSQQTRVEKEGRTLEQDGAPLLLDEQGSVRVTLPAVDDTGGTSFMVLIEEDLREQREARGLRFAGRVLDRVDPHGRFPDISSWWPD